MNQSELFPIHREPLAAPAQTRRTDPSTSHEAAQRVNASGQAKRNMERVVDLVYASPGSTSRELSELPTCDLDRYEVARRLADAEHAGLVVKGGKRTCQVAGTAAVTWEPN